MGGRGSQTWQYPECQSVSQSVCGISELVSWSVGNLVYQSVGWAVSDGSVLLMVAGDLNEEELEGKHWEDAIAYAQEREGK